jgi:hypothetical protein
LTLYDEIVDQPANNRRPLFTSGLCRGITDGRAARG